MQSFPATGDFPRAQGPFGRIVKWFCPSPAHPGKTAPQKLKLRPGQTVCHAGYGSRGLSHALLRGRYRFALLAACARPAARRAAVSGSAILRPRTMRGLVLINFPAFFTMLRSGRVHRASPRCGVGGNGGETGERASCFPISISALVSSNRSR